MTMITPPVAVVLNTPNPTVTAPNGNTACAGSVMLSASPNGNPSYQYEWYKDNVLIPGANTSTYYAVTSGWYKCRVFNTSCGWDYSNDQIVSIGAPAPVISATSNVICSQGSSTFSCKPNSTQAYSYQWYRNGVLIPNATAPYYSTSVGGTLHCNLTNSCSTTPSTTLPLIVKPSPTATIYTPASTVICTPQTISLKAAKNPGAMYTWYRNGGLWSSGTDSVCVATTAGNFNVVVSDTSCFALSSGVALTSATGPSTTVTTSGYPQICSGEVFTMKAPSNAAYTYQWKKNGAAIGGATDSVYAVTTTGVYSVLVTNSCGSIASADYSVAVKSKPSAVLTASGPTTFCNGDSVKLQASTGTGYTYYWKRNGTIVPGTVASAYTVKQQGNYKAGVYSQYGCLKETPAILVSVPCREGDVADAAVFGFDVYPNPTNSTAELILYGVTPDADIEFYFTDLMGRVVDLKPVVQGNRMLLSPEWPGVYLVTVVSGTSSETKRLIRVN